MDIQVGEAGWRNEAFQEDNKGKMLVIFHAVQKKMNKASIDAKRPIFKEVIHIKKVVPGQTGLVIDRPMRETDMDEFPIEWARYEQKKANIISGTPIDAWPILSDTQKAEFRSLNIFTIDQFANLNDDAATKIMGFNELRAKARAFVMAAKDSEQFDKIRADMEAKAVEQDREMAELRAQLAALTARKKPGRKPREAVAA